MTATGITWNPLPLLVAACLLLSLSGVGAMRVGFDVAPAPGDERGDSQRIADAVHAVLLLVRELRA